MFYCLVQKMEVGCWRARLEQSVGNNQVPPRLTPRRDAPSFKFDMYIAAARTVIGPVHPVRTAKANADYVALIEKVVPSALSLYHRMCAIVHPSDQSIGWLFDFDELGDRTIALTMDDAAKMEEIITEFPSAIEQTFSLTCNCALLTLRVLHKFPLHPKIPELRKVDWSPVGAGRESNDYCVANRSVSASGGGFN